MHTKNKKKSKHVLKVTHIPSLPSSIGSLKPKEEKKKRRVQGKREKEKVE
jgi:hypothetical protein